MGTSKPISTISYNTPAFLEARLNELIKARKIQFWAFVLHKAEADELKDHIHLFIDPPIGSIKPLDITEYLMELDPTHPGKPLKCLSWSKSDFDNWWLYCTHNKAYLASKNQSRAFQYSECDFRSSDEDDFHFRISQVDVSRLLPYRDMLSAIQAGMSFAQYFSQGRVPIPLTNAYRMAWACLIETLPQRDGKASHTPSVDPSTGELLSDEPSDPVPGDRSGISGVADAVSEPWMNEPELYSDVIQTELVPDIVSERK